MNQILIGEILALGTAASGAVSSIILADLGKKVNSSLLGYVRMLIAGPLMAIFALIVDGTALFEFGFSQLIWVIVSGIVGFFVTDIFLFKAYAVFGAQETMTVMCFTPVLSTIISIFFFSEVPTFRQLVGIALTVGGILIMVLRKNGEKKKLLSLGFLCALLAAVLQSMSDMTAKASVVNLPYISTASLRGVSGLTAWLIWGLFTKDKLFKDMDVLKKPANMGLLVLSVVVSTWLGTTMAIGALKFAPAGIATSLKQLSPVLILPYDFFVLKKRSLQAVAGTLVAVAGVIFIFS